jgi:hypothetical protein
MQVREFLADDRFLSRECRNGRGHSDPAIRQIMSKMAVRRMVRCASGLTVSIQYSPYHYCNAREPFMGGEWLGEGHPIPEPKTVELGFPNHCDRDLREYAEEGWRPFIRAWRYEYGTWRYRLAKWFEWVKVPNYTETVYPFVPMSVIERVVARHGGITEVRADNYETWEPVR